MNSTNDLEAVLQLSGSNGKFEMLFALMSAVMMSKNASIMLVPMKEFFYESYQMAEKLAQDFHQFSFICDLLNLLSPLIAMISEFNFSLEAGLGAYLEVDRDVLNCA